MLSMDHHFEALKKGLTKQQSSLSGRHATSNVFNHLITNS